MLAGLLALTLIGTDTARGAPLVVDTIRVTAVAPTDSVAVTPASAAPSMASGAMMIGGGLAIAADRQVLRRTAC